MKRKMKRSAIALSAYAAYSLAAVLAAVIIASL